MLQHAADFSFCSRALSTPWFLSILLFRTLFQASFFAHFSINLWLIGTSTSESSTSFWCGTPPTSPNAISHRSGLLSGRSRLARPVARTAEVNENFQLSRQYWAHLAELLGREVDLVDLDIVVSGGTTTVAGMRWMWMVFFWAFLTMCLLGSLLCNPAEPTRVEVVKVSQVMLYQIFQFLRYVVVASFWRLGECSFVGSPIVFQKKKLSTSLPYLNLTISGELQVGIPHGSATTTFATQNTSA